MRIFHLTVLSRMAVYLSPATLMRVQVQNTMSPAWGRYHPHQSDMRASQNHLGSAPFPLHLSSSPCLERSLFLALQERKFQPGMALRLNPALGQKQPHLRASRSWLLRLYEESAYHVSHKAPEPTHVTYMLAINEGDSVWAITTSYSIFRILYDFLKIVSLSGCVWVCTYMHVSWHTYRERSGNNLWKSVFSLHHMNAKDWNQVIRLGGKHPYLLSNLAGPVFCLFPLEIFSCYAIQTGSKLMETLLP